MQHVVLYSQYDTFVSSRSASTSLPSPIQMIPCEPSAAKSYIMLTSTAQSCFETTFFWNHYRITSKLYVLLIVLGIISINIYTVGTTQRSHCVAIRIPLLPMKSQADTTSTVSFMTIIDTANDFLYGYRLLCSQRAKQRQQDGQCHLYKETNIYIYLKCNAIFRNNNYYKYH